MSNEKPRFPSRYDIKQEFGNIGRSIVAIFAVLTAASCIGVSKVNAEKNSPPPDHYIVQKTGESGPDPLPGHQGHHQLVMAIPPRDDDKIWTGTISWTASYPVEMSYYTPMIILAQVVMQLLANR